MRPLLTYLTSNGDTNVGTWISGVAHDSDDEKRKKKEEKKKRKEEKKAAKASAETSDVEMVSQTKVAINLTDTALS